MTELGGRESIINTPPNFSQHPKVIREQERFWLEQPNDEGEKM
jgi:hypothetical protein